MKSVEEARAAMLAAAYALPQELVGLDEALGPHAGGRYRRARRAAAIQCVGDGWLGGAAHRCARRVAHHW
ncbi:MAG: hypothetical protein WDN76_01255 [Alphaproteobacteria bacterium]